jgi:hypothetical protein
MIYHLSVGDVARWYAEYYPGLPVGSLVPGKCFYCWPELSIGDEVAVRPMLGDERQASPAVLGGIRQILSAVEHGSIYLVSLKSGEERFFIRAELRKLQVKSVP